jgi:hypothetical protein
MREWAVPDDGQFRDATEAVVRPGIQQESDPFLLSQPADEEDSLTDLAGFARISSHVRSHFMREWVTVCPHHRRMQAFTYEAEQVDSSEGRPVNDLRNHHREAPQATVLVAAESDSAVGDSATHAQVAVSTVPQQRACDTGMPMVVDSLKSRHTTAPQTPEKPRRN